MSKASVYRYFESKEAIFLELLVRETEEWVNELERELADLGGVAAVESVAVIIADSLAQRPRWCALAARLSDVLERNISPDAIRSFKRENLALTARLVTALHQALPAVSLDAAQRFVAILITFQNGLFPTTDPPPSTKRVLAEPEFSAFRVDYRQVMRETATLLLRALSANPQKLPTRSPTGARLRVVRSSCSAAAAVAALATQAAAAAVLGERHHLVTS